MRKAGKVRVIIGVIVVFIVASVFFTGCPGPERVIFNKFARKYNKEPVISVYINETGAKQRMPIEDYIMGVVAGEMEKGWPVEAYAAQAIVARTFTMEFLARGGTRKKHGTDISTDVEEAQAYNKSAITREIRRAVQMTRGQVIVDKKRMYIKGWFSASCGGHTVPARVGLGYKQMEPAYITPVSCPEDKMTPALIKHWQATVTMDEIKSALAKTGRNASGIKNIKPIGKKVYNRTVNFEVDAAQGKFRIPAAHLRTALGPEKMRSIWLKSFTAKNGKIEMSGKGFGHGVGLCQWGAHVLAKEGKSPQQIIKHYYPKTEIQKIW